ncbi:exosortase C-terminal domain/associated protein EpsI [Aquabacterium sp.]|uniref:exosortase C-terminal domain/associated protein EpsI n=1 Tax=Aquabacterium TaxID=92793 RepID=UPI001DA7B3AD|nr:exosortase C-terminal domain/associated protein EpsI [Aquabacterium sp.]MBT9609128.1 EpsI family protein [Aquabacterium sp.]
MSLSLLLPLAWLTLAVPSLWDWLFGTWTAYSQGHELLLLGVAGWLVWRQRDATSEGRPVRLGAIFWLTWVLCLLGYVLGRSQEFIRIELLSLWLSALLVMWSARGWQGLRRTWFAWLFCLFAMPLPFSLVLALTAPLKEAVSMVATTVLSGVGYPVGRSGVVITVGQYQLLVAEACAGLHSMFILEAMGLLYSHLAQHTSWWRNGLLAVLAVPVSFLANVVRVMILVVVTHHFGDAAGQGFVHNFAGLALFAVALVLMAGADAVLGLIWPDRRVSAGASADRQGKALAPTPMPTPTGVSSARRGLVLAACLGVAAWASWCLRPGISTEAEARAQVPLESLFPLEIPTQDDGPAAAPRSAWRLDPVASGMVRPAFEAARRFQMYDQVLERTYVHPSGQRVMLSVAYGRQQSVGLQMHRPEVCYRAGGFRVSDVTPGTLALPGATASSSLPVVRLVAALPERPEPITYWRLFGDEPVRDEAGLKLRQLVAGLSRRGLADGLLVRLSTIDANADAGWRWQEVFARDLAATLSPSQRLRVLGAPPEDAARP